MNLKDPRFPKDPVAWCIESRRKQQILDETCAVFGCQPDQPENVVRRFKRELGERIIMVEKIERRLKELEEDGD